MFPKYPLVVMTPGRRGELPKVTRAGGKRGRGALLPPPGKSGERTACVCACAGGRATHASRAPGNTRRFSERRRTRREGESRPPTSPSHASAVARRRAAAGVASGPLGCGGGGVGELQPAGIGALVEEY